MSKPVGFLMLGKKKIAKLVMRAGRQLADIDDLGLTWKFYQVSSLGGERRLTAVTKDGVVCDWNGDPLRESYKTHTRYYLWGVYETIQKRIETKRSS